MDPPSAPALDQKSSGTTALRRIAIEMAIEIVDLPIKNGDFSHSYVTNYQRVKVYVAGTHTHVYIYIYTHTHIYIYIYTYIYIYPSIQIFLAYCGLFQH